MARRGCRPTTAGSGCLECLAEWTRQKNREKPTDKEALNVDLRWANLSRASLRVVTLIDIGLRR